jgi:hypothetical protein
MELRYRARAGDRNAVADLARPERFRAQFIDRRNPSDIRDDIRLGFKAAGALRRPDLLVELILSLHEIDTRADALGDEVFEAFMVLGELHAALGLLQAEGVSLSAGKGYELVDAFLAKQDVAEARKLFDSLEPIGKLLGSEALNPHSDDSGLSDWAARALVFRAPDRFLAVLGQLCVSHDRLGQDFDIEAYRTHLKLVAARGQLERNPNFSPDTLSETLQMGPEHRGLLLLLAARLAFEADDYVLASERLELASQMVVGLKHSHCRRVALIATQIGRLDLAEKYLQDIPPPTLAEQLSSCDDDELKRASLQIIRHAELNAWLGREFRAGESPQSRLFAIYQSRLETLGRLLGGARRGIVLSVEALKEFRATLARLSAFHAA